MTMSIGLSLYLDLLRFCMAVVVWIGHSTFAGYTGHRFMFWFTYDLGPTAVMGFFVLSGFVIAHTTQTTEPDPASYAIARASRLYSIVIPALLLTVLCDASGGQLGSLLQTAGPRVLPDNQLERYVLSLFMIQDFWIFPSDMAPGSNTPFWSLSYEIVYYICYGLFLAGNKRFAVGGSIAMLAIAGPRVAALFPTWLLGVALYRWQRKHTLPLVCAIILLPLSAGLLIFVGLLRRGWDYTLAEPFHLDYSEALLVSVNILAAAALSQWLSKLFGRCGSLIRWLGSLSFAIYLCHAPLLLFLTVFKLNEPGSWQQNCWLFGGGFVIMILISWLGDHGRRRFRALLRAVVSQNGR
jgi:peptidoglycan/LPS O-acetylase OafA/YrhL